eukprot:TRINITY_DN4681_c0_g1_i1.p1 TRINITY_DN4681_c0_g1~~TRINITY_DN4681_c0_g1_i1.p1  ORF type:complete len:684 (+),score=51.15 TRINITY_DN4681_c0_g1_i1:68-2053(+)
MLRQSLLCLLLAGSWSDGTCIHDKVKYPELVRVRSSEAEDRRGTILGGGLRVLFYFGDAYCKRAGQEVPAEDGSMVICEEQDVLTESQRGVIGDMLEKTAGWANAALNVKRKMKTLTVGTQVCGQIPVPSCMLENGVSDADFVGFVSAYPMSDSLSSTIAWSVPCQEDHSGRTTAGHINIVPSMVRTTSTPDQYHNAVMVLIHELFHALGLSSRFWSDENNGNKPRFGWFSHIPLPIITAVNNTYFLTTPAVKREVQAHFNCTTIPGAPIEKHGGAGSQGSHWEQIFLGPEAMTYSISSQSPVMMSRITLAYFEDTGFYIPNYEVTERAPVLRYGKDSCLNYMKCEGVDMCDVLHQLRCSPDRIGMAICTAQEYCKHWAHQYLCSVPPVEPCHTRATIHQCYSGTAQQHCVWDSREGRCYDALGNSYTPTARCFDSSIYTSPREVPEAPVGRCYHVNCNYGNGTYSVVVGDYIVPCVEGKVVQVSRYGGTMTCARFEEVCDVTAWKGREEQLVYKSKSDIPAEAKSNACIVEPVLTLMGCECQMSWEVSGQPSKKCTQSCCSFEGEAKWCFVTNPDCQGAVSGPCENLPWFSFLVYGAKRNRLVLMLLVASLICSAIFYARQQYLRRAAMQQQQILAGSPEAINMPNTAMPTPVSPNIEAV